MSSGIGCHADGAQPMRKQPMSHILLDADVARGHHCRVSVVGRIASKGDDMMKCAGVFTVAMLTIFAHGQASVGFAQAQEQDLQRKHQLQMQREAAQYAQELARIQAQNAAARANDISSASAQTSANAMDVAASGTNFLELCSSVEISPDKMNVADLANMHRCQGFMEGLRDGIGVAAAVIQHSNPSLNLKGSISDLGICFPDEASLLQVIRVVLKYIREHPEQAHLPSAVLVFSADLQAFPCAAPPTDNPAQKP